MTEVERPSRATGTVRVAVSGTDRHGARAANDRLVGLDLELLSRRERVADELHEVVIQRIFEAGLAMAVALRLNRDPIVTLQIEQAVEVLDQALADIRSAVLGLRGVDG